MYSGSFGTGRHLLLACHYRPVYAARYAPSQPGRRGGLVGGISTTHPVPCLLLRD